MKRKISKHEIIFIISLLLLAVILWMCLHLSSGSPSGSISIMVDGRPYGTYSLTEDQVISINDTNVCEIRSGHARMTHATCPDGLCMHQSAITGRG